ncbi:MarR family winged helix-turn-helix transcriptional regulator [Spartinivicinus marinus]|nr:winged helix-turn-helix transcriptional regulator [Spartinivicinus marinus]MCX4025612.1 winged helix-turn-helix transcriptional regulator [Spartinivicinus marinus]
MTLTQLEALLTIAKDEGISVVEVQRRANLSRTTSSRIVRALAGEDETSKGYKWVEMRTDPHDVRRRVLYLNEEGKKVIQGVLKHI